VLKLWAVVGAVVGICLCGTVPAYAQGTFALPGAVAGAQRAIIGETD
jgi:hypothetical protein